MTTLATEAKPGVIYRRTRGPWDGEYYTVPKSVARYDIIDRLSGRELKGRDRHLLHRLRDGWVLMRRHLRFRDAQGRRGETKNYVAVPSDYRFRAVKRKPGYTKRRREVRHG